MGRMVDLVGQRYGRLVVIERASNVGKQTAWKCRCDCGKFKTVTGSNLKTEHVKSCGCLWGEVVPANNKDINTRHGESHTKLHRAWANMRYRCFNTNCNAYMNYGGRGIKICDEWDSYEAFRDWSLANGYEEGLSIDRIDNDGNYEPSNCRWVDAKTQGNNRRSNNNLTYNGDTHTIKEWSEITGINWSTIKERLKQGWTVERALSTK